MDKRLLLYDNLAVFQKLFNKGILTTNNLCGGQVKIDTVHFPDGGVREDYNFWGYQLEKEGVKYLISSQAEDGSEVNIKDVLPCVINGQEKVAIKGQVHYVVHEPIPVIDKEEKSLTFRELVDFFCSFEHSNKDHQRLYWFIILTQYLTRGNFRICTPAGFGKDSAIDILGNLVGRTATIENPTVAKLEERAATQKLLAVNEVVDISTAQWRDIEQFLLAAGAFKPEITKRSRAFGNIGESIDISEFSILLMYNDIDHYIEPDKFFDLVTKKAVKDRFPPMRLYGRLTEDFNATKGLGIERFVGSNMHHYKRLVHTMAYYKTHLIKEVKPYSTALLNDYPERWKINITRLLNVISVYCDTQEEFDFHIKLINNAIGDYKIMLKYPYWIDKCQKELSNDSLDVLYNNLKAKTLFMEKIDYLQQVSKSGMPVVDTTNGLEEWI